MARVKEFGVGFEGIDARRQIACARVAEESGYGSYWVPEDYFYRGAFALASAIACSTKRLRVGVGVVNTYTRHPALTAMEFGALDEIAEGRAILGIGAGFRYWMETQMGIPYAKPSLAMREAIDVVRRMLRGETVTTEGKVVRTRGAKLAFAPRRVGAPIYLGVLGAKNLEMAGEIADGVILSAMTSPAYVRFAAERLRAGAERAGRRAEDLELAAMLLISVSEDEQRARDAVKPFLSILLSMMAGDPSSAIIATTGLDPEELKHLGAAAADGPPVHLVTDWMIDTFTVAGSPENCRARLQALVDAGLKLPIAFEIPGVAPEETIAGVHRHLMPHFL